MSADILKYYSAFVESQKAINYFEIDYFPFSLKELLKKQGILIFSFAEYQKVCPDTTLEIDEAICTYSPQNNTYLILYNEQKPINRVRFSIAHELGHIVLNHLDDERTEISRGGIGDMEYFVMEGQANTFAGNFLVPPILLSAYLKHHEYDSGYLARLFNVSQTAMEYRKVDYDLWSTMRRLKSEIEIYRRCKKSLFPNYCPSCKNFFFFKGAEYCIYCGDKNLQHYKEYHMKYKKIELNQYGKPKICPVCNNEETDIEGDYCQICGTYLVNKCSDALRPDGECDNLSALPGNARYCPHCGSPTTFLVNKRLDSYEEEKTFHDIFGSEETDGEEMTNVRGNNTSEDIEIIEEDRDLPF